MNYTVVPSIFTKKKEHKKVSYDDILHLVTDNMTNELYEVLDGKQYIKAYFDYDKKLFNCDDYRLEQKKAYINNIKLLQANGFNIDKICVLDSSSNNKISQHYIINDNNYYNNGLEFKDKKIKGTTLENIFDMSVYKDINSRQLFRCIYSNKKGEKRPLLPIKLYKDKIYTIDKKNVNISDYFVTVNKEFIPTNNNLTIENKDIDCTDELNDMFGLVNINWKTKKKIYNNKDCYMFTNDTYSCISDINHTHQNKGRSCLFLYKRSAVIKCFSHGNKKITKNDYPELDNIRVKVGFKKINKTIDSNFQILLDYILTLAKDNNYKKYNGYIYKPHSNGIPTLYEEYKDYRIFLNDLFDDRKSSMGSIYHSKVTLQSDLIKYLETYSNNELPFIKKDNNIYALNNIIINIDNVNITKVDSKDAIKYTAYKHLDLELNNDVLNMDFKEIKTPLFDKIVLHHIQDIKIYYIFLAMIGRLLYPIKKYDDWQVMVYLLGPANTGKSTILDIISALFDEGDIGTIQSNMEKTFGLQNIYEKRVIINTDTSKNIAKVLPKENLQKMISGESISIAFKGTKGITKKWNIPFIFAGNHHLPYYGNDGAITRRCGVIKIDKDIKERDSSIKYKILKQELGNILIRCVKAYKYYISVFNDKPFSDWYKLGINYFEDQKEEFKSENNLLYRFLNTCPDELKTNSSNVWIEYKENSFVNLETFKKSFNRYLDINHNKTDYKWSNVSDNDVLIKEGYKIKTIHICASCKKKANKGCCDNYSTKNRRKKKVIIGMVIRNDNDDVIFGS